ncbi:hypothetical protein BB560_000265 [Smittium megazygosporum]|uniref:Uncharacterized protein n=1 Tax=Smittium megazygosporum TaxID=133381 RepID=A0A2T9ZKT0_9FUNG|nr:hypothetical protein BB560_000265 [Smittium megazygosporum]
MDRDFKALESIKHIILVLSGKGGVGKSSVSVQIAYALKEQNKKVGILDLDLCGPSIPRMLGVEGSKILQDTNGWVPVYVTPDKGLGVMSIGFLLPDKNSAVVWRGPKKSAMIKQFLTDVYWGDLDYLIIDTPPGTSDEHLSVIENLQNVKPDGAVIVTTPQVVSLVDVRKEINFCKQVNLPVLGLIENMSGYVCENCKECTNIFSTGGGKSLCDELGYKFLGYVPIDPQLGIMLDNPSGKESDDSGSTNSFISAYKSSPLFETFKQIATTIQN